MFSISKSTRGVSQTRASTLADVQRHVTSMVSSRMFPWADPPEMTNQIAPIQDHFRFNWSIRLLPLPLPEDDIRRQPHTPSPLNRRIDATSAAMGIWETLTDIAEAAVPWSTAYAEAPAEESKVRRPAQIVMTESYEEARHSRWHTTTHFSRQRPSTRRISYEQTSAIGRQTELIVA